MSAPFVPTLLLVVLTAVFGPPVAPAPPGPETVAPRVDEADALRRLGDAPSAAWIADGILYAVVRAPEAEAVEVLSAVQRPLERLTTTGLWGGAFPLDRADEAVLSCGFGIGLGASFERRHDTAPIRGPRARPAPTIADPLRGTVTVHHLAQPGQDEPRAIHVFLPPDVAAADIEQIVFLADGQSAARYAAVVEPLVAGGVIPPTAIVGVASDTSGGRGDPAQDRRAIEYLVGFSEFVAGADAQRFDDHWTLFTERVPAWVADELGIVVPPHRRIVAGTSNGGAFAATVAARLPDRFGASIILSSGWLMVPEQFAADADGATQHRAFFSAGTYEPRFLEQTTAAHAAATEAGYVTTLDERVGGHDPLIWQEQLATGLQWLERQASADS